MVVPVRVLATSLALALAACAGPGAPPAGDEPPPRAGSVTAAPAWIPPAATLGATTTEPPGAAATSDPAAAPTSAGPDPEPPIDPAAQKARVVAALAGRSPRAWGQVLPGVITRFSTKEPALALTLDACGGPGGDGYDAALIDYLRREKAPATLFVTSRWIAAQRKTAASLAKDPLFEIENHGSAHRPCSVNGRSAYDIRGTKSVADAVDEIQRGALAIRELTGRAPRFYRPGTAYFDDVCLDVAAALGEAAAGFAVNGDGGTGFSRKQVKDALLKAPSGSIVLLHMNHPGGQTAEGVMDALPILRDRGVKLVRLRDVLRR